MIATPASYRLPWDYRTEVRPEPTAPTAAEPGSAGKIEVMIARRLAGQSLFHGDDVGAEPADLTTAFAAMMLVTYNVALIINQLRIITNQPKAG